MKKTSKVPMPIFAPEDDERKFWATDDSDEYINWNNEKRTIFPDLKPTVK